MIRSLLLFGLLLTGLAAAERSVVAGNLIYAGDKTSVCFSDRFLNTVATETGIACVKRLSAIRLDRPEELSSVAFAVMNGQETWSFTASERTALKAWLDGGGFLLASAGCSSQAWSSSFRSEIAAIYGAEALQPVPVTHALFSSLFELKAAPLKSGGEAAFEGLFIDGRLAVLFSPEGLNDTEHTQGCCCCGGNEVRPAEEIVANALVHALTQ